jgi:hypothetical protein
LRTAFASALATIYLARYHGEHDQSDIDKILKNELLHHASAIEEFRPFVSDSCGYQKAWEDYRKIICIGELGNEQWDSAGAEILSEPESKIHAILKFARVCR